MFLTSTSRVGDSLNDPSCEKCRDPQEETTVSVVWLQMRKYTLTVDAVRDTHGRKLPERVTQLDINVEQAQASPASTKKQ